MRRSLPTVVLVSSALLALAPAISGPANAQLSKLDPDKRPEQGRLTVRNVYPQAKAEAIKKLGPNIVLTTLTPLTDGDGYLTASGHYVMAGFVSLSTCQGLTVTVYIGGDRQLSVRSQPAGHYPDGVQALSEDFKDLTEAIKAIRRKAQKPLIFGSGNLTAPVAYADGSVHSNWWLGIQEQTQIGVYQYMVDAQTLEVFDQTDLNDEKNWRRFAGTVRPAQPCSPKEQAVVTTQVIGDLLGLCAADKDNELCQIEEQCFSFQIDYKKSKQSKADMSKCKVLKGEIHTFDPALKKTKFWESQEKVETSFPFLNKGWLDFVGPPSEDFNCYGGAAVFGTSLKPHWIGPREYKDPPDPPRPGDIPGAQLFNTLKAHGWVQKPLDAMTQPKKGEVRLYIFSKDGGITHGAIKTHDFVEAKMGRTETLRTQYLLQMTGGLFGSPKHMFVKFIPPKK